MGLRWWQHRLPSPAQDLSTPLQTQQLNLLRAAAERTDRLVPRPDGLGARGAKSLSAKLIAAGNIEPVIVPDGQSSWGQTPEDHTGFRITAAGLAQIGPINDGSVASEVAQSSRTGDANGQGSRSRRITKQSCVLAMLQRPQGVSLDEIIEATGWLPHSSRAALSGLRKKGHRLIREQESGGPTRYRIAADEASAEIEPDCETANSKRIEG